MGGIKVSLALGSLSVGVGEELFSNILHEKPGCLLVRFTHADFSSQSVFVCVCRFCSVSVAGRLQDFHVDVGGSATWHSVLHGNRVCRR